MNDSAIKNYAVWARRELMSEVGKRCAWWGISEGAPEDVDAVNGRILSARERGQRADLLRIVRSDGYAQLVERAAYIWFNRLLAIRFMEANDRLPGHVRMLSSADGSFEPQCLREALDLPLGALDRGEAARLVQEGDDEALFRLVFLAQCSELSECMPAVFEPVGSAMELLLPTGLLRADGVVGRLVSDIPEDDWREGVEIVGWMYQYYVSERKDEVFAGFKKGKKAERDAIAPATQLFTPHWIVRYLTENSLGRLWMLNHPDSKLVDKMPYFIAPREDTDVDFKHVSSPEDISVVDPACGSGHILVYAFELLAAMYVEAGYSNRDAARLIIEKNLTGLEIDPRAAAMASFALTMKACELDGRFLRRGVSPHITVLSRVEFDSEELVLCPNLNANKSLFDAITHLDECGSLLHVFGTDLRDIENDINLLAENETLFAGSALEKLEFVKAEMLPLSVCYDVAIANPPYMGSGSYNPWLSGWMKKHYPYSYRDMCVSFIERGLGLSDGLVAMITMQGWMFQGTYEKLRFKLFSEKSILSMAHLGTRAFDSIAGEVVSTTAFVLGKGGGLSPFVRLTEYGSGSEKQRMLHDVSTGLRHELVFYSKATDFVRLPGAQVAYWLSEKAIATLCEGVHVDSYGQALSGLSTSDNETFLRYWQEVNISKVGFHYESCEQTLDGEFKWIPHNKGGSYRKWFGNWEYLVNWENDGKAIKHAVVNNPSDPNTKTWSRRIFNWEYFFKPGVTWSDVATGNMACRIVPPGVIFNATGPTFFPQTLELGKFFMALMNTSVFQIYLDLVCPGLHYNTGPISRLPMIVERKEEVVALADVNISLAKTDWDSSEESWGFKHHPLV